MLQIQEVVQEVSSVMLQHIDQLKHQVNNFKYPQGTRENPALSCREIILGHPQYKTGWWYFKKIDDKDIEQICGLHLT